MNTELRMRKNTTDFDLFTKSKSEPESMITSLKQLLEISRNREKKLVSVLEKHGIEFTFDLESGGSSLDVDTIIDEFKLPFLQSFLDRGFWLAALLVFQSFSSFILSSNTELFNSHPSLVYFLTMLVGSGGNAGGSSCVRVIRGLGNGSLNNASNLRLFLLRELSMAILLSLLLGSVGFIRASTSHNMTRDEVIAITTSLIVIVFVSIVLGSILPLILNYFKLDPAHGSASIQVIMDISGVLITCFVSSLILTNISNSLQAT